MSKETYIIEVDKYGCPTTDTGAAVIEIAKRENWLSRNEDIHIITAKVGTEHVRNKGVPVGSLEFMQNIAGITFKPINIPDDLAKYEYIARDIGVGNKEYIKKFMEEFSLDSVFVKSNTLYKGMFAEPYDLDSIESLNESEEYFFSTLVDIESEWRVFVYDGMIVDVKMYLGDWRKGTDIPTKFIENVVERYVDCPKAYTLDIGVLYDGTPIVIEAHNFLACGLYGFNDRTILKMVTAAYNEECSKR